MDKEINMEILRRSAQHLMVNHMEMLPEKERDRKLCPVSTVVWEGCGSECVETRGQMWVWAAARLFQVSAVVLEDSSIEEYKVSVRLRWPGLRPLCPPSVDTCPSTARNSFPCCSPSPNPRWPPTGSSMSPWQQMPWSVPARPLQLLQDPSPAPQYWAPSLTR